MRFIIILLLFVSAQVHAANCAQLLAKLSEGYNSYQQTRFIEEAYQQLKVAPLSRRLSYITSSDRISAPVKEQLRGLNRWLRSNHGELTAQNYFSFYKKFQNPDLLAGQGLKGSDQTDFFYIVDHLLFDFKRGKKEALEMAAIADSLSKGVAPTIVAISDLHGGSDRAIPMIAYALGIQNYKNIKTVEHLRQALPNLDNRIIEIIGLNDVWDRGLNPVEAHKLVEYLVDDLGIGKHISGNHEQGRLYGLLGIHKRDEFSYMFDDAGNFIGTDLEKNHIAHNAYDSINHANWAEREIDELNRIRSKANANYIPLTKESYVYDSEVLERALWDAKHFSLYYIDYYGNFHLHGLLPVKKVSKKEYVFDVAYGGKTGIEALELMQSKVRNFFADYDVLPTTKEFQDKVWSELGEVFRTVHKWYRNDLATSKAPAVADLLSSKKNFNLLHKMTSFIHQRHFRDDSFWFMGHNPIARYQDEGLGWLNALKGKGDHHLVAVDGAMSEGYDHMGHMVIQGGMPDGSVIKIQRMGFSCSTCDEIEILK